MAFWQAVPRQTAAGVNALQHYCCLASAGCGCRAPGSNTTAARPAWRGGLAAALCRRPGSFSIETLRQCHGCTARGVGSHAPDAACSYHRGTESKTTAGAQPMKVVASGVTWPCRVPHQTCGSRSKTGQGMRTFQWNCVDGGRGPTHARSSSQWADIRCAPRRCKHAACLTDPGLRHSRSS